MAQDEVKSDEWKKDELVVCLRKVDFMANNWDLLEKCFDLRKGIVSFAQANDLKSISAICKEEGFPLKTSQIGEIGGVLIDHYYNKSGMYVKYI